jgi:pimeloyl-ACP methyl ester carboxylesterase
VTAGKRIHIAAWLFYPDDARKLGDRPVTMVLLNGGSYDKRYFHVEIPGHPGYSAAQHLAALGNIIAADDAIAAETAASIGLDSIRTGIIAEDAAKIDVPIYLCLGERDVSPDPHAEPGCFRRSTDFTLHILPRSAHCQNFASTRHEMWNRMHAWARSIKV